MNNLNYKVFGMALATVLLVISRPDYGIGGLTPISGECVFYLSVGIWLYFTVKVALHNPYTDD